MISFKKKFRFIYLETESVHKWGMDRERGERKSQAGSIHTVSAEPNVGAQTHES